MGQIAAHVVNVSQFAETVTDADMWEEYAEWVADQEVFG
jgi:hypothetical protein